MNNILKISGLQIIFYLSFFSYTNGQNQLKKNNGSVGFIENKGQIYDQNFKINSAVKYILPLGAGMNVDLKANGFCYDIYKPVYDTLIKSSNSKLKSFPIGKYKDSKSNPVKEINFSRIDVSLPGANSHPDIIAESAASDYFNYYNSVSGTNGVTKVKHFKKITYKDIYPGIDLVFNYNEKDKSFKYNFIVQPGADISLIQIEYKGATKAQLIENKIQLIYADGILNESIPSSWIRETNKHVDVKYKIINSSADDFIVGFYCDNPILIKETLVIDPNPDIVWGTYYGGFNSEDGREIKLDENDNVYMAGWTKSLAAIATSGSYQDTLSGVEDAFIAKFDSNGVRLWCTFYGGTNSDGGISITYNDSNIYLTGSTQSENGIATPGAFKDTLSGEVDCFIAKFDCNGFRQWATYYGGEGWDWGNAITHDQVGNIILSGYTESFTGIATPGTHQDTLAQQFPGGGLDAFVAKFNKNGQRMWGSYYGGSMYEESYGIACDDQDDIFITGATQSENGIATIGAVQDSFKGYYDVFVAKFNSIGSLLWSTYLGGRIEDYGYDIDVDKFGNVYIASYTSSDDFPTTPNSHQPLFGGFYDAALTKFDNNGGLLWSTYYGGAEVDCAFNVSFDNNANVYITGSTRSDSAISTANSYQPNYAGCNICADAMIAKFNPVGTLIWATYYGGPQYDFGADLEVSKSNMIYLTGWTQSDTGIATPGSFQPNYSPGIDDYSADDAFLAKFSQDMSTGILMLYDKLNILLYPNPSSDYFNIEAPAKSSIEFLNIKGQLIKALSISSAKISQQTDLWHVDISTLPSGVYVVEVKTEKGMVVKKFVKE